METVSADHQVVHDAITGQVEPGNEFRDQFKVNSEHLIYNLTHEEWDDNGAAAGSLFDWTKDAATGPEAGIAAATATPTATTSVRTRTICCTSMGATWSAWTASTPLET